MSDLHQPSSKLNSEWFDDNHEYMDKQERLEHYQWVRRIVEREVRGMNRLLDVGNGGFFNYDTAIAGEVTAVDLFLPNGPGPTPNSKFRQGSFLDLPFEEQSFDCIIQQNVLHHVTGRSVGENHKHMRRCLSEMFRCLAPGGKAVVVESTVGGWFNAIENVLYTPILHIKRWGHPVTYQFTAEQIVAAAREIGFEVEELTFVPKGSHVLQMGYVVPSWLTPVKPIKMVARRPAKTEESRISVKRAA